MILSLKAIDKEGKFREFSCWFDSFEVILDALSLITSGGGQLLTAEVLENKSLTALPVEVFDGQSFSKPLKALEKEWQQVLSEPVNRRSVHKQWLLGVTRQRLQRQTTYVARLEAAIETLTQHQQRAQDTIVQETLRSQLLGPIAKSLLCYQRHLETAQSRQKVFLDQLTRLGK